MNAFHKIRLMLGNALSMGVSTLVMAASTAAVLLATSLGTSPVHAQFAPTRAQPPLRTTPVTVGLHVVTAEVAATPDTMSMGLMFREKMAEHEGMLFIWPQKQPICMWMKNTLLPLSVAFMDETGKILNIEDMQPQTLDSHCAKGDGRFALEMNQGWFKKRNIQVGTRIGGIPTAEKPTAEKPKDEPKAKPKTGAASSPAKAAAPQ
jgi:uncharacterized protein